MSFASYHFKLGEFQIHKKLFCNLEKSEKIVEHLEKQMNDLNANIINLDSDHILFMNKILLEFFKENFKNTEVNDIINKEFSEGNKKIIY